MLTRPHRFAALAVALLALSACSGAEDEPSSGPSDAPTSASEPDGDVVVAALDAWEEALGNAWAGAASKEDGPDALTQVTSRGSVEGAPLEAVVRRQDPGSGDVVEVQVCIAAADGAIERSFEFHVAEWPDYDVPGEVGRDAC